MDVCYQNSSNFENAKYFENTCWSITWKPEEAFDSRKEDDKNYFTEEQLNDVKHVDANTAFLIVPLTRFQGVSDVIPLGQTLTLKVVLCTLHEFYHKPLTKADIDKINGFPRDFEYTESLVGRFENGEEVCYADLIGGLKYFEYIQRVASNVYRLKLGS